MKKYTYATCKYFLIYAAVIISELAIKSREYCMIAFFVSCLSLVFVWIFEASRAAERLWGSGKYPHGSNDGPGWLAMLLGAITYSRTRSTDDAEVESVYKGLLFLMYSTVALMIPIMFIAFLAR